VSEMSNKSAQATNPQTSQSARTRHPVQSTTAAPPVAQPAQAAPTKPMTQTARPGLVIMVRHDHGFAPNFWPQCWGLLQVSSNHLQYRVMGTSDGRRDNFDILLSQIQEVRPNRVLIRNFPAFHVTVAGRIFNFIPQGMAPLQAAAAIQQKINGH